MNLTSKSRNTFVFAALLVTIFLSQMGFAIRHEGMTCDEGFPTRFVNVIVVRSVDRFECHVLSHAGCGDPATLLLHRGFVPTRSRAVISAHIKRVVYNDRPDPGGRAVRHPILSERRDAQIVSVGAQMA